MGRSSGWRVHRSEEHTSQLQSLRQLVCRLLLEKKKTIEIKGRRAGGGVGWGWRALRSRPAPYRGAHCRANRRTALIAGDPTILRSSVLYGAAAPESGTPSPPQFSSA